MVSCIFTDQFIQKTRNLQNYFIGPIPWKIKPASLLKWNSCSWIGTCRQSFNQFCLVLKKKTHASNIFVPVFSKHHVLCFII